MQVRSVWASLEEQLEGSTNVFRQTLSVLECEPRVRSRSVSAVPFHVSKQAAADRDT